MALHSKYLSTNDSNEFTESKEKYLQCISAASYELTEDLTKYNYIDITFGMIALYTVSFFFFFL